MAKQKLGDKELRDQIIRARERASVKEKTEPRAKSARFDPTPRRVVVELTNGLTVSFPPELLQGLEEASHEELSEIRVLPTGNALSWDRLDVQFSVPRLVHGVFGNKPWMAHLGRLGGLTRSEAKAAAARVNGTKGGRPALKANARRRRDTER